ncbi:tetratricopeptide repeat protein [Bradyrhizobium iriomotense]|uniref:tetratricopeptide repeat protein n=1 Tax=Bradyrhizobium iriomotense TaxID=441950 RepID=UPI001B8A2784|nr:tetratricopeptide repeat protein [Bradyrhizobium iriomotense]MBR0780837.1 tetratricopeptide repeat protein [Bradyrhizobium iriomotense]
MSGMTGREIVAAAICLAAASLVSPSIAESNTDWKCTAITEIPVDERIAACTSVLDAGKFGERGVISARFNRASAYSKKGAFELAVADYSELIRLHPQNVYAHYNRAYSYYQLGELDRAIADYGEAIRLNPKDQRAYYSRGVSYSTKGDFDRAIADYTRAIELKLDPSLAAGGARPFYHGGDLAPTDPGPSAQFNPLHRAAYLARGVAQSKKGNIDGAISDYEAALALDPGYPPAYVYRAGAYRAKHELARAMDDCDRAVAFDPKDPNTYMCRTFSYLAMGDPQRAVSACDLAIERAPKAAGQYRICAMAHLQAGSTGQAISNLDRSRELDPKEPYGAIWREIAGWRSNAPETLSEATAKLDMTKWPAPIIRVMLGTMTAEELLRAADDADPIKKKGQICEANFFTAELALQRRMKEEARRLFGLALADCPPTFVEAQAAAAELKALGVNP